MAIIIVTTAGAQEANSYASEEEALAYFEAKPGFLTLWNAMTPEEQKARLVDAARSLDRMDFCGDKLDYRQPLAFPRSGRKTRMEYVSSLLYGAPEIPREVKAAQCELVIGLYYRAKADGSPEDRGISSVSLGGAIEVEFDAPSTYKDPSEKLYTGSLEAVKALLRPWLGGGDNTFVFEK
jgi:hypothetical protein